MNHNQKLESNRDVTDPISIDKSKEIISPISFDVPKEIIHPISFDYDHWRESPISFDESLCKETDVGGAFEKYSEVASNSNNNEAPNQSKKNSNIITANQEVSNVSLFLTEEIAQVGNFTILVKSWYQSLDGQSEFLLSINLISGRYLGDLSVQNHEIKNLVDKVQKRFPMVLIKKSRSLANSFYESLVREQLINLTPILCITKQGWNLVDGRQRYIFKGVEIPDVRNQVTVSLPTINRSFDLLSNLNKCLSVYRDASISWLLILYSMSGICAQIFDEAGYRIRFLLFIIGKTGSFKTSIAKVFYTQLADERYRNNPRRLDMDTKTAFERALVEDGKDTVILCDDLAPSKSIRDKNFVNANVESLIRMIGDGATKSRSNSKLENIRGEGVRGTIVLTGELQATGHSSNLRCLYCNIVGQLVDLNVLSELQRLPIVNTIVYLFSDYLSENWSVMVQKIAYDFPRFRDKALNQYHMIPGRMMDCFVTLFLISQIFQDFLETATQTDLTDMFSNREQMLVDVVRRGELTDDQEPVKIFIDAFRASWDSREFRIAGNKFNEDEFDGWDGYLEDGFIYIKDAVLYSKVVAYITRTGQNYTLNLNQTKKILCEEGYAVSAPNGKNKVTYHVRVSIGASNRKYNFVKLKQTVLLENEEA